MDAFEVQIQQPQQRLTREESYLGRHRAEVVDAMGVVLIFDRHAHPHVLRPIKFGSELQQPLMALSEHLEDVPIAFRHDLEDLLQEVQGHLLMEQVTHGVDEYATWLTPAPRFIQAFGVKREVKAIWEVLVKAFGDGLGVAVFAARAYLVAPDGRVPGLVRPLDRCVSTRHTTSPGKVYDCIVGKQEPIFSSHLVVAHLPTDPLPALELPAVLPVAALPPQGVSCSSLLTMSCLPSVF